MNKLVHSDRYQDYVFKDGEFVGQFDEMYRRFPDPWNCVADWMRMGPKTIDMWQEFKAPPFPLEAQISGALAVGDARVPCGYLSRWLFQ